VVFEWHAAKARANLAKHGVPFGEATTVFLDPLALTFPDPDHSEVESREITIGHGAGGMVIFVSHALRQGRVRIISARRATKRERRQYEEGIEQEGR
jgi:uncharacterized DUF497 family protein